LEFILEGLLLKLEFLEFEEFYTSEIFLTIGELFHLLLGVYDFHFSFELGDAQSMPP